ncbi:MAG: HD domain-containing phosphohydrolase [Burkholderiales bacterium]
MRRRYPLHIHITTLFLLLLLLVGGLIGGFSYKLSRDMLETAADDVTQRIVREMLVEMQRIVAPAEMAIGLISESDFPKALNTDQRLRRMGILRRALDNSAALSSVYAGYADGEFFFMRRVMSDAERSAMKAPPDTRYVVQSIERGVRTYGSYIYLDANLSTLHDESRPDYAASYDPRTRGWFRDAAKVEGVIHTPPYVFFSNRKIGMTLARLATNSKTVIGADILLETLSANVARQRVTPNTQIALVNPAGEVIAHERAVDLFRISPEGSPRLARLEELGVPVLPRLGDALARFHGGGQVEARQRFDGADWRISINPVVFDARQPLYLIAAIPDDELLAAAVRQRSTAILIMVLVMLFAVPLTWAIAHAIARPLRRLSGEAEAIRRFNFSKGGNVSSMIREVDELAETMDDMKRTIRRFIDISAAVAAEEDFDRLLPMLLRETLAAADADAGVLYLADEQGLVPATAGCKDGADLKQRLPAVVSGKSGPLLEAALKDGKAHAAALQDADLAALGLGAVAADIDATQGIAVPLLNRRHQLVGAMLLLRRDAIEDSQLSFVQALSGSAASSLETSELIKAQKDLFEAFIQLIAGAIDAKSPYTGGHCARVPELTKMLARAACAETSGPFRDFKLDEDDWEAVHVASWLHDCGKVTTPEFVVDKATKLETIYDRIHEVRMRFEVLKRDAEIACLKAVAAGANEAAAREQLAAELRQLDDDYAFIATCNEGGEFMAPEKIERLKKIAERTWLRTLDDRIGIAHEEKARKMRVPAAPLPVPEPLLVDKPEHRFERRPEDRITDDNKWGFRVKTPALLYNRGELYNLSVGRGTLSEEERYKINEHMIQTIIMLTQLPFPKHLRNGAEIAGGHHEKMDGTGYPKRLKKDDMSPVARMMAIADIFEALTAADRPYKKGKTLSEAIKIMSFMKKDQHIDPELFDLFLRSGIYREYAQRFMAPEQIDEVDIAPYLSAA